MNQGETTTTHYFNMLDIIHNKTSNYIELEQ
jgi:hypothetical protein